MTPIASTIFRAPLALALISISATSSAQSVPNVNYLVLNNTRSPVRCSTRTPSESWSPFFTLGPAGQLYDRYPDEEFVFLFCAPPVERAVYRLRRGERYSLLPSAQNQTVSLRRITPDQP